MHRLPDGSLTSEPSPATLDALPWITEPNAATRSAVAVAPSFASIKGFVGIHEAENVAVNHYELKPPDQGLAVYNNVAAEINNNVVHRAVLQRNHRRVYGRTHRHLGVLQGPERHHFDRHPGLLRSHDQALVPRRDNL
jgi:hypothetical protein